jgi:hypothetical protein
MMGKCLGVKAAGVPSAVRSIRGEALPGHPSRARGSGGGLAPWVAKPLVGSLGVPKAWVI